MPVTIRFVFYLLAFLAFIYEAVSNVRYNTRGYHSTLALGLALWVAVPLWVTADRAF